MKNKFTLNALVKNNLKNRRKHYTLMVVGILISMILSSTVMFFVFSMSSSVKEYYKINYGNCFGLMYEESIDDSFYENALEKNILKSYSFAHVLGKIYPDKSGEELNLNVAYLDEECKDLYYISLLDGKYPTKPNEIALEKATLDQIDSNLKVGDSFTVYMRGQNAFELLDKYEQKTFTLTGILRNKRSNIIMEQNISPDFTPSAFVFDDSIAPKGSKEAKVAYLDINSNSSDWYSYVSDNKVNIESESNFILYLDNDKDEFISTGTFFLMILGLIFGIVLLLASFIAIINAMNSNIADRKKQIGMLRTVGATKRQIRKIFGREAVIISLICLPVSLTVSFFAIKGVAGIFGEEFVFVPNFLVLILSGIFSVICIIISSLIPVFTASKISPIQSIRNIQNTRKMKLKKIKSKKSFKVSSLLSNRNTVFNRAKQVTVSVFLIVTIVFSCYGFSLVKYESNYTKSLTAPDYTLYNDNYINMGYNIRRVRGFSENNRQDIVNTPYFNYISGAKQRYGFIENESISEYFKALDMYGPNVLGYIEDAQRSKLKMECQTSKELVGLSIVSFDEDLLKSIEKDIVKGKLDIEALNSGKEVVLLAPDKVAYGQREKGVEISSFLDCDEEITDKKEYYATADRDIDVGDILTLDVLYADTTKDYSNVENTELFKNEVKIGSYIKALPKTKKQNMRLYSNVYLITTHEGMKKLCGDVGYYYLSINLNNNTRETLTEETDKEITSRLEFMMINTDGNTQCMSYYADINHDELSLKTVFLVIFSAMILLLAGSISIINNSLSSRIRESKREIGTLRAVGATQKDLTMSYIRQLLSMFGWGIGLGFGLFFLLYAGIRIYCKVTENGFRLSVSVLPAIIVTLILLIVCSLNLYFKIKKETKNSIIDNIREL